MPSLGDGRPVGGPWSLPAAPGAHRGGPRWEQRTDAAAARHLAAAGRAGPAGDAGPVRGVQGTARSIADGWDDVVAVRDRLARLGPTLGATADALADTRAYDDAAERLAGAEDAHDLRRAAAGWWR